MQTTPTTHPQKSAGARRTVDFSQCQVFSSFSVADTEAAKQFYDEILGLDVSDGDQPDMLELKLANGNTVFLYGKDSHQPATFTVLNFKVDDIDVAVRDLKNRGIEFEQYTGEIQTDNEGIFRSEGMGIAWFKDPAGNILSILQED